MLARSKRIAFHITSLLLRKPLTRSRASGRRVPGSMLLLGAGEHCCPRGQRKVMPCPLFMSRRSTPKTSPVSDVVALSGSSSGPGPAGGLPGCVCVYVTRMLFHRWQHRLPSPVPVRPTRRAADLLLPPAPAMRAQRLHAEVIVESQAPRYRERLANGDLGPATPRATSHPGGPRADRA